jgi:uncharacterized phage-associated protein
MTAYEEATMIETMTIASYIKDRLDLPAYDTKKLQKLVYFTQAWSLGWTGRRVFADDFEAWPDGPVVRKLYAAQAYGSVPGFDGDLPDDVRALIESVIAHYGHLTYKQLVDLTHEHTPWVEARGDLGPSTPSRVRLDRETMRRFYTREAIEGRGPERLALAAPADSATVMELVMRSRVRWSEALLKLA